MPLANVHYPGLDALRGIAVILVVLYHYVPGFDIGWIGVDLFFVLSGFLITTGLLKTKQQSGYFKRFFVRRILRIFPLYFLTLALFYIFAPLLFSQKHPGSAFAYYTINQSWFWTFTENWLMIKKGLPPIPYLQHFWSLAVEEQFYVFWPFIIFFIHDKILLKHTFIAFLVFAFVLRTLLWAYPFGHEDFYYNTIARTDSLSAGALIAVLKQQRTRPPKNSLKITGIAFTITLVASFWLYSFNHNNPIFATVGYSINALFFAAVCHRLTAPFSIKIHLLERIGKISYGIYVYHLPVLLLTHYFFAERLRTAGSEALPVSTLLSVLAAVITLLASTVSYYAFELPFLNLKKKFS